MEMPEKEVVDLLKWVPMFAGCDVRQLSFIAERGREEKFDSGARIVKEGEISFHLFLILEGEVDVRREGKVLATLESGNFFGEMALLEELPRSADVIAVKPTRCLVISRRELKEIISSNSDIGVKMLQELSNRLRSTDQRVLIGRKERKSFNEFLFDYLQRTLEAGKEEVAGLRGKLTVTYYLLVGLSTIMFSVGAFLLCVPGILALGEQEGPGIPPESFFASGLGIADLVALFLLNPIRRIHGLMGDIGQMTLAVNSFRSQVALRLLETSSEGRDTMGTAAEHIDKVAKESIESIQVYFEPRQSS